MEIIIGLIVINIIAFFIPYIVDFSSGKGSGFQTFLELGWNSAPDIRDGEYYRLLTATFLHADIMHLFINMYSLWAVGPTIANPKVFGVFGFTVIYFASGLGGSLTSFLLNPSVPSVGASGAIFGLVGALLAYSILNNDYALLGNIVFIIIINLAIGFFGGGRIDNYGHIGGLVTGVILGFVLLLTKR